MHPFIRVAEIWTPDTSGQVLSLQAGSYGPLTDFAELSQTTTFHFGEGLPGLVWAQGKPVVLRDFSSSVFQRTEQAQRVDLTSGIAIPVFAGADLKAVVVFLCGDRVQAAGAIEVWEDDGLSGLALLDGYYGDLERFEWLSRRIRFPRGVGLPGSVWARNHPVIQDLRDSNAFLRSEEARKCGMSIGFGLPFNVPDKSDDVGVVVTFLSAGETPIASRVEIWEVDSGKGDLFLEASIGHDGEPPQKENTKLRLKPGQGIITRTLATGLPALRAMDETSSPEPHWPDFPPGTTIHTVLAIPVYSGEALKSVAALYF